MGAAAVMVVLPTAGLHGGGDVMISEYRKVTKALLLNDCMFIFNFLKYFTCHHHRHHACHAYLYSKARNKVYFLLKTYCIVFD